MSELNSIRLTKSDGDRPNKLKQTKNRSLKVEMISIEMRRKTANRLRKTDS